MSRVVGKLLVALSAPVLSAQWRPLAADATPPQPPRTETIEPTGTRLLARGGHIVRVDADAGNEQRLEETRDAPGRVNAAVISPCGVSYFAADGGLYVSHPSVTTLDRLTLGDVPSEPIVGVVADEEHRVWLATRDRLLVLDSAIWFGVAHGEPEELPPGPFLDLATDAAGDLVLRTGVGRYRYRRDQRSPSNVHVDVVAADADGNVRLRLDADGDPAGSWRFREVSHHVLRPIEGGMLHLRGPGDHDLLVYAFDRDLDRSQPARVHVHVPAPPRLDVRLVAAGAVGFAVLTVLLAAWNARRRRLPWWRGLLDATLFLAVAGQLAMAMTPIGRTYPFIGFTMYGETYGEDDVLYTPAIVGLTAEGDLPLRAGVLDFATDGVWRHVATLAFGDAHAASDLFRRTPERVEVIDLRIRRCRLTRRGPRDVAPFVLARLLRREAPR